MSTSLSASASRSAASRSAASIQAIYGAQPTKRNGSIVSSLRAEVRGASGGWCGAGAAFSDRSCMASAMPQGSAAAAARRPSSAMRAGPGHAPRDVSTPSSGRQRPSSAGRARVGTNQAGGTPSHPTAWRPLSLSNISNRSFAKDFVAADSRDETESWTPATATPPSLSPRGDGEVVDAFERTLHASSQQLSTCGTAIGSVIGDYDAAPAVERARLRDQTWDLKAELNASEEETRRFRQRLVHLEGDLQGKVQWMLSWERQVVANGPAHAERGPAGASWSAWKTFVDRGAVEAQKTLRLLTRVDDLQFQRAAHDELRDGAELAAAELRDAEEKLATDLFENVRLASMLRRREAQVPQRSRGRGLVDSLRQELALREQERARLVGEEEQQAHLRAAIRQEVEDERLQLRDMPVQVMKRRIQRAVEQREDLEAQADSCARWADECHEETVAAQRDELERLHFELLDATASMVSAESDAECRMVVLSEAEDSLRLGEEQEERRRNRTISLARAAKADAAEWRRRESRRQDAQH
mmetsp:Transcript_46729/g.130104  ORF Transcript_46729/g.130104 Transcript_46729/m.130104 type:complete len:530 (-) Transcript_46729:146-1735(-)